MITTSLSKQDATEACSPLKKAEFSEGLSRRIASPLLVASALLLHKPCLLLNTMSHVSYGRLFCPCWLARQHDTFFTGQSSRIANQMQPASLLCNHWWLKGSNSVFSIQSEPCSLRLGCLVCCWFLKKCSSACEKPPSG